MNVIEAKAFKYLTEKMGYLENDIKFQPNASPDFVTSDNRGYEIKTCIGNNIYFHKSQFELLKKLNNIDILVFRKNEEMPISIFPTNIISENCVVDGIKIKVSKGNCRKDMKLEKGRLLKYDNYRKTKENLLYIRKTGDCRSCR